MANESALRDDNRTPTLIFEENGEIKRVSLLHPLPVLPINCDDPLLKTESRELLGTQLVTLLTPSPGKSILVKGAAIIQEPTTAGGSQIIFNGGKLIHRVYRSDQSNFVDLRIKGAVNEQVRIQTIGFSAGQAAFFIVNYREE